MFKLQFRSQMIPLDSSVNKIKLEILMELIKRIKSVASENKILNNKKIKEIRSADCINKKLKKPNNNENENYKVRKLISTLNICL